MIRCCHIAVALLSSTLLLIVSQPIAGQESDDPGVIVPPVCADRTMRVMGIMFGANGMPLNGGQVMIIAEPISQLSVFPRLIPWKLGVAKTDAKGSFSTTVPMLSISHVQRYCAIGIADGHGVGVVELDPFAVRHEVTIRLDREQPVRGRLTGPEGKPAKGVYIALVRFAEVRSDGKPAVYVQLPPPARKSATWTLSATTDDDGAFVLHGIPHTDAAKVELEFLIDDPRFAPVARNLRIGEGRERDGVFVVSSNSRQLIEMRLSEPRIVEGTVVCQDTGMALAGAWVGTVLSKWATPGDSQDLAIWEKTDGKGRFRTRCGPSGENLTVYVYPPTGVPYLAWSVGIKPWPVGKTKQEITIEVPRGILVHGKVLEDGTGKPVAAASVEYQICRERPKHLDRDTAVRLYWAAEYRRVNTDRDGSFQLAVAAEPGHLLVKAPSGDFVSRLVSHGELQFDSPGGFWYALEGLTKIEPSPGQAKLGLTIPITRGRRMSCRVVGPDGKADDQAFALRNTPRHSLNNQTLSAIWPDVVHKGAVEILGCDPAKPEPVYFLNSERQLGTTIALDARNSKGGDVEVKLQPCGGLRVRFVDETGKPWSNYSVGTGNPTMTLWFVFKEGQASPNYGSQDFVDVRYPMQALDWKRYGSLRTNDNGVIIFPSLVADAPYKLYIRDLSQFMFGKPIETSIHVKVKVGETLDAGDVVVKRPKK